MTPRTNVPRPVDDESRQQPVILLGGALRPAADDFRPLRRLLAGQVRLVEKDLEALAGGGPDYHLDREVDALMATADERGWERFQLVASGEGGSVALFAALRHPSRILSLGLSEPVWAGNREPSGEETSFWQRVNDALRLEDTPAVSAYIRMQLNKHAQPSPDEADLTRATSLDAQGMTREFEQARGDALRALWKAFAETDLDYAALLRLQTECYIAVGSDSDPAYEALARRLHGLMPDLHVEIYEGRSRLDPPHWAESERFAVALSQLWRKSMKAAVAAGVGPAGGSPPHYP